MKPYRIAVCLSGQPRTWKACVESIRRFFEPAGQVDYFISTWDTNSWWRDKKPFNQPADTQGLQAAYGAISCRVDPLPDTTVPWVGLFQSMERSILDKKTHEIENNFVYDVVVKGRLDCVFDPKTVFRPLVIEPMTAYAVNTMERMPHEYYGSNFSDMWFYSGSMEMDIIGDCTRGATIEENEDYGPGVLLWRHMTRYQIQPNHSSTLGPNVIVREEFGHMDGVREFDEIKRLFRGWAGR